MRRIWDQMNPKRVAHRDERGRYRKGQSGHIKAPLPVAQKQANYVLACMHAGKEPDIDKWHAQRAARIAKKQQEAATLRHLRSIGLI